MTKDIPTLVINAPARITETNAAAFKRQLQSALTKNHHRIELHMHKTLTIDSSGLGALIFLQRQMTARCVSVCILHPAPEVRKVLEMTSVAEFFDILD